MSDEEWRIKEGDTVTIMLSETNEVQGIVRWTPCATGDSWVIENDYGVRYIQLFYCMTRQKPLTPTPGHADE